jgi:hypothetical protein
MLTCQGSGIFFHFQMKNEVCLQSYFYRSFRNTGSQFIHCDFYKRLPVLGNFFCPGIQRVPRIPDFYLSGYRTACILSDPDSSIFMHKFKKCRFLHSVRIRFRMDPHHFGKSDPDPHQRGKTDPHPDPIKVKASSCGGTK